jgi:hypothetical protein
MEYVMGWMVWRKTPMNKSMSLGLALAFCVIGSPAIAHEQDTAKPHLLLGEIVQGMPKGETQEVRVLTASFKPGDKTVFHTHRFPVTVYILEGAFHWNWRDASRSR